MFNKNNFCHVASNNRNEQKAGIFVYKTTDDLATVLSSGYFNEKIIDINLHDLIIHVKIDAIDRTKVERNLLCVVERTLDNVGTSLIKSNWEKTIEETIADIQTIIGSLDDTYVRIDGTSIMTAPLKFMLGSMRGAVGPYLNGVSFWKLDSQGNIINIANLTDSQFLPVTTNAIDFGRSTNKWKDLYLAGKAYVATINNGADLSVPNKSGTLATTGDVELAARSGRMITDQGVWYAKMYAATVPPAAENGTNYADFSQTDGQGNPIIVIYNRVNGAWVQDQTITPPAEYDGYVLITSKIWDIVEQSGQQGGRVLWNHTSKEFTPYPTIISFENASLTGNSTVVMPNNPTDNNIPSKKYVDDAIAEIPTLNVGDIFFTMRNDNELNGAVECDGATYNTTDFTGAESIGALLEAGKIDYISLTAYADAITQKGWCDKIGWDGTGNTQFRVPTLNAYIWQKLQTGVVGDGTPLGFNYNGNKAILNAHNENLGVNAGWVKARVNGSDTSVGDLAVSTDATQSGLLAGTSTDISQQRVMIQLAVATTDQALETCTGVLADVAALKYDYVVDFQRPTAANNYTWYRKYKSGWVEQGGINNIGVTRPANITFPVEMSDGNYTVTMADCMTNTYLNMYVTWVYNRTATGFTIYSNGGGTTTNVDYTFSWQVSGMSAS